MKNLGLVVQSYVTGPFYSYAPNLAPQRPQIVVGYNDEFYVYGYNAGFKYNPETGVTTPLKGAWMPQAACQHIPDYKYGNPIVAAQVVNNAGDQEIGFFDVLTAKWTNSSRPPDKSFNLLNGVYGETDIFMFKYTEFQLGSDAIYGLKYIPSTKTWKELGQVALIPTGMRFGIKTFVHVGNDKFLFIGKHGDNTSNDWFSFYVDVPNKKFELIKDHIAGTLAHPNMLYNNIYDWSPGRGYLVGGDIFFAPEGDTQFGWTRYRLADNSFTMVTQPTPRGSGWRIICGETRDTVATVLFDELIKFELIHFNEKKLK